VSNVWILAARPKTLSAAVVPVMVGSALAAHEPSGVLWWVFVCALCGALLIQIATNLINDALDFKKGTDTAERVGPLRVTQAGLVSADAVLRVAVLCLIAAALFGIPLFLRGGWPLLLIGLLSMALAYGYTGGPLPLAYHGLGEIFVMIFFGLIAVGGTFYAHTLQYTTAALLAGIACGSLANVLLVINNLRDAEGDARVGKHTLAVRLGPRFARREAIFFLFLPFATMPVIALLMRDWRLILTLMALPIAVILSRRLAKSEGAALNRCLAIGGALQWAFGVLFVLGTVF
jgi:1,4-dihydroxy-2-naphthoate octaprenyltransferase